MRQVPQDVPDACSESRRKEAHKRRASTRDMMVGDGRNGGYRYTTSGGASITSGPAKDPAAPDGRYTSVSRPDGGKKSITYDKDGNIVKNQKNSRW